MKQLIRAAIVLLAMSGFALASDWVAEYDKLLSKYVTPEGVRYKQWHKSEQDIRALNNIVDTIGKVDATAYTKNRKLAFYMNAYNAWMLHLVLKEYPIDSVKSIGWLPFSVFKSEHIIINGSETSLDYLEKTLLLKQLKEPLIHVGVNCASKGCPPLRSEAFRANEVMAQLKEQATIFVNSTHGSRLDKQAQVVYISSLFDWYAEDFIQVGGIIKFLNRYQRETIPQDYKVKTIDYDWSLNSVEQEPEL